MSQEALVRGARGGGLTLFGNLVSLAIQFASLTMLSRMLGPSDFGLVAMVGVFIALGTLIRDFGLPLAALQAKELSHQQASNLFWVNLALASASGCLLALATPLLVTLYGESRLAVIVPWMAMVIVISGASSQLQIQLARDLRFRVLVFTEVSAQLIALVVAVSLAYGGARYWALVGQSIAGALVILVARWVFAGWVPSRPRRGHGSARLLRTGTEYGLAQFLTFLQNNADSLIIGSTLGANSLGFYNRGYQLLTGPVGRLLDPLTQVIVPTLNRARAEGRPFEPILLRVQFLVGCVIVWIYAVAAGTASRLVPLVLGSGWESTVHVFQILAAGGAVAVFSSVSYWAFILNEGSRELLHYNILSKPIVVACLTVGSILGIEGVAWGYAAGMAISWPLNLAWLARTKGMRSSAFAANGVTVLFSGAAGGLAACGLVEYASALGTIPLILLGVLAGTATMAVVLLLFPGARRQLLGLADLMSLVLGSRSEESNG